VHLLLPRGGGLRVRQLMEKEAEVSRQRIAVAAPLLLQLREELCVQPRDLLAQLLRGRLALALHPRSHPIERILRRRGQRLLLMHP
jgi:hypothetical protein